MGVRIPAYSHFPQWEIGLVPFPISLQDGMGWEWELRVGSDTLANTEANDFLFIDTQQAVEIAKFFKIPTTRLKTTAGTKGFNRQPETPITHAIMLHLVIDGRRFLNQPFLMLDLGQHDVIIEW